MLSIVEAFNAGRVPEIASTWEGISTRRCELAASAATDGAIKALSSLPVPMKTRELTDRVKRIRNDATQHYEEEARGDPSVKSKRLAAMQVYGRRYYESPGDRDMFPL
jgi:hypothetical protein